MSKANDISNAVMDAQNTLAEQIKDALNLFTESTGLICPSASWDVANEFNARGEVSATEYMHLRLDLQSGRMQ